MTFDINTVERAWNRARGRCESCGKQLVRSNRGRSEKGCWEPHHRKPASYGGTDYLSNCVILCTGGRENCHLNIGHNGDYNKKVTFTNSRKITSSSGCFIATAAYGTSLASEIKILRDWRDNNLKRNFIGRLFIKLYYVISPPIATFIAKSKIRREITRYFLTPVIVKLKRRY